MSDRSQKLYLADIVESIEAIESFVVDMDYKTFAGDRAHQRDIKGTLVHRMLSFHYARLFASQRPINARCVHAKVTRDLRA